MMKVVMLSFAAACLSLCAGCGGGQKSAPAADTSSGNAVADYVNSLGNAQKSAQKTLGSVGLDQAIKTFYTQEGRLPKDLDELVSTGVINQVPPPPRGMNYEYNSATGAIKVVPE